MLRPRIEHCFEAGALATGASLEIRDLAPTYSHMVVRRPPCSPPGGTTPRSWAAATAPTTARRRPPTISTDMANVSLAVPSIHPMIGIETNGAVNHQPEFAAACLGPSAEQAVFDGALGHGLDGHRRRHRPRAARPPPDPNRLLTEPAPDPDRLGQAITADVGTVTDVVRRGEAPMVSRPSGGLVDPERLAQDVGDLAQRRHAVQRLLHGHEEVLRAPGRRGHVGERASTADWSRSARTPPGPLDLGPLLGGVDREHLGRSRAPRR